MQRGKHSNRIVTSVGVALLLTAFARSSVFPVSSLQKVQSQAGSVLRFTVTDENGNSVTKFSAEDIRLLVDGKPQPVVDFSLIKKQPLSLAVLIDISGSQKSFLSICKLAAAAFLETTIREATDKVAVVSFNVRPELRQGLTGNVREAVDALNRLEVEKGTVEVNGRRKQAIATAINDALWFAAEEILKQAPDNSRKAIVIFSDGVDNASRKKNKEALHAAIRSQIEICPIAMTMQRALISQDPFGGTMVPTFIEMGDRMLSDLAIDTGGVAFYPATVAQLRTGLERIRQHLKSSFLISFSAENPLNRKERKIKLEFVGPELKRQKWTINYRSKQIVEL